MTTFKCVIHGSFSKHLSEIRNTMKTFKDAGIEVLAPNNSEIVGDIDGFGLFEGEEGRDPRLIELLYLQNLKQLGNNGFSYFVNPGGYIGKSASYELGIAQLTNIRCFFSNKLTDHPAYIHNNSVISAAALTNFIEVNETLPLPKVRRNENYINSLWEDLMVPGSVVATGAIIEYQPRNSQMEKEILLVKTHKWNNRYSIVGGKVRRNERLKNALLREVMEETKLNGKVGSHICTFDQIKNSGYYRTGVQHIFVDNIVEVKYKKVTLNEEAQEYIWALPSEALQYLDIEPNARETIEIYSKRLLI
jgi:nucleoside triphosphatase